MPHKTSFSVSEKRAFRVLLTAAEAYPSLEQAFMDAREEIWASFRIFDPATRLRSDKARDVGSIWFDLIAHTLARGVSINLVLADFDPTACADLHRGTWRSVRMLLAAAEIAGPEARLRVIPAMHPARMGLLPRLAFLPLIARKLGETARRLNALPPERRAAALRDMPGLGSRLRGAVDGRLLPRLVPPPVIHPAIHHQKLAVFDRRLLYIGGLDLDERRYDTPAHDRPGAQTWHDVQVLTEGRAADEAQAHLEGLLDICAGRSRPTACRRILRTVSAPSGSALRPFGPRTVVAEIATAHRLLTERAERLIYLETQFFRDPGLARALARAALRRSELGLILVLPAAPETIAFEGNEGLDARYGEFLQARSLRILRRAFGRRLFVGGAAQPKDAGPPAAPAGRDRLKGAPLVYIHSKVSIFDERAAIVSSANLNGRSLAWDTEAGLYINAPEQVRDLRGRVMSHWLPDRAGPEFLDPAVAVAAWRRLAFCNLQREPAAREGFLLPYDLKAAEDFGRDVPLAPVRMV